MWVEEVNAKGGLMIKEYGKRLPLDVTMYDDKSDVGTMTKLFEKAIVEDKVDLIFSPWDTNFLFAAAPIATKHKMVLMGGSGGALKLKKVISKYPYYFQVLNFADTQIPAVADVFKEVGREERVHCLYPGPSRPGIQRGRSEELPKRGIKILAAKSFSPRSAGLHASAEGGQGVRRRCFHGFPVSSERLPRDRSGDGGRLQPEGFLYDRRALAWPGIVMPSGPKGIDGVMGAGAWSAKTSAGAKDFFERYTKRWGHEPEGWGTLFYYSSLQFFGQAIEEAGTLNNTKIRDVMATKTYQTAMGPFKFHQATSFRTIPGEVGQWQNGKWEVIDVGAKRTAKPMYPKPAWEPPPAKK